MPVFSPLPFLSAVSAAGASVDAAGVSVGAAGVGVGAAVGEAAGAAVVPPDVSLGIGLVRTMPHAVHTHSLTPSCSVVGARTIVPSFQACSVLGMPRLSVTPQVAHSRFCMPSSMQVACVVVNHAPNLCPVLGMPRLSVAPQVAHSRFCMPSSVQVACVVVNHAPKLCPLAGVVVVPPSAPQSSQTNSVYPGVVHVANTRFQTTQK